MVLVASWGLTMTLLSKDILFGVKGSNISEKNALGDQQSTWNFPLTGFPKSCGFLTPLLGHTNENTSSPGLCFSDLQFTIVLGAEHQMLL